MKLNTVAVSSTDISKAVEFYQLLGFTFPSLNESNEHVESIDTTGVKLMIDSYEILKGILGEEPRPSNHSGFALQYDSPIEIDTVIQSVRDAGFNVVKEPWDAFWGQRYAIVADPDGYKVDMYATL